MTEAEKQGIEPEPVVTQGDATARVTIYEVAARAGVSIATVSHAMNRPDKVAASTRGKVLQAVDDLGFMPKATAVSLARKGVRRIAVAGPFRAYPTYFERLVGVLDACANLRFEVVVFDDDDQPHDRSPLLSSMPVTGRVDGIIVLGVEPSPEVARRLQRRRIPAVLLDRPSTVFPNVTVNDELGGRMVAEHLIAQGARSFVFASPPRPQAEQITSGEYRMLSFRNALESAGLTMRWVKSDDSIGGGRELAEALSREPSLPDAVFAVHDTLAAGIVTGLRDAGISVPGQVRVVGYDDSTLAQALDLTTVRQPFVSSGRVAAEMLISLLADPSSAVAQITLSPELVVRRTA